MLGGDRGGGPYQFNRRRGLIAKRQRKAVASADSAGTLYGHQRLHIGTRRRGRNFLNNRPIVGFKRFLGLCHPQTGSARGIRQRYGLACKRTDEFKDKPVSPRPRDRDIAKTDRRNGRQRRLQTLTQHCILDRASLCGQCGHGLAHAIQFERVNPFARLTAAGIDQAESYLGVGFKPAFCNLCADGGRGRACRGQRLNRQSGHSRLTHNRKVAIETANTGNRQIQCARKTNRAIFIGRG